MPRSREVLEDVVTLLISRSSRPITRTALVKLLYFIDLRSYERRGRPLTDLQWIWHFYGPYSPEITTTVTEFEGRDEARVEVDHTVHGSAVYRILPGPHAGLYGALEREDRELVEEIIRDFGTFSPATLTKLAYQTEPIERAPKRGEYLDFTRYQSADAHPPRFVPDLFKPASPKMDPEWGEETAEGTM